MSRVNRRIVNICMLFTLGIVGVLSLVARSRSNKPNPDEVLVSQAQSSSHVAPNVTPPGVWRSYVNEEYHYALSYTGTLGFDYSNALFETLFITIDTNADPLRICAAKNSQAWSASQLFENWKRNPPVKRPETVCADYPSYARISGSDMTIGARAAYQVASFRGSYETVCTYITSPQTLLAVCLPPEDPNKSAAWKDHLKIYEQVVASLRLSE